MVFKSTITNAALFCMGLLLLQPSQILADDPPPGNDDPTVAYIQCHTPVVGQLSLLNPPSPPQKLGVGPYPNSQVTTVVGFGNTGLPFTFIECDSVWAGYKGTANLKYGILKTNGVGREKCVKRATLDSSGTYAIIGDCDIVDDGTLASQLFVYHTDTHHINFVGQNEADHKDPNKVKQFNYALTDFAGKGLVLTIAEVKPYHYHRDASVLVLAPK